MRLSGRQYEALVKGLVSAFPNKFDLAKMLTFRLDARLAEIAPEETLENMAFLVVQHYQASGEIAEFVVAARASRPKNPELLLAAEMLELAPAARELEKIVNRLNKFLDVSVWRARLGEIEGQVCRVEVSGPTQASKGTGFLVGPDIVLTNHHVVAAVLETRADGSIASREDCGKNVRVRFDYKRPAVGAAALEGTIVELAATDWLLDATPPSPIDFEADPKSGTPSKDHLDFALLRLASAVGSEPIGAKAEPGAERRGWIRLDDASFEMAIGSPLLIVQHPSGDPIKLAFDTNGILANEGTRIRYATNTMPGSSGSPCFDIDWKPVALHHSGDRQFVPQYNEGIPLSVIRARLERKGLMHLLEE
jgi:hypothetical protein